MVIFAPVRNAGEMKFVTLRVQLDLTGTLYALEIFPFFLVWLSSSETADRLTFFWRGVGDASDKNTMNFLLNEKRFDITLKNQFKKMVFSEFWQHAR